MHGHAQVWFWSAGHMWVDCMHRAAWLGLYLLRSTYLRTRKEGACTPDCLNGFGFQAPPNKLWEPLHSLSRPCHTLNLPEVRFFCRKNGRKDPKWITIICSPFFLRKRAHQFYMRKGSPKRITGNHTCYDNNNKQHIPIAEPPRHFYWAFSSLL